MPSKEVLMAENSIDATSNPAGRDTQEERAWRQLRGNRDRGPFVAGRIIDLSKAAAEALEMMADGVRMCA
jgi:hypothetical protein